MKILHIGKIIYERVNGPRYSVPALISSQNKLQEVEAFLLDVNVSEIPENAKEEISKYDFKTYKTKEFERVIEEKKPNIVVFHSFWILEYVKISKILNKKNIPYIVVPRSALTNMAVKNSKIKKIIGRKLFFDRFLKKSLAIHFLTNEEKENSYYKESSFVVGNGSSLPKIDGITKNTVKTLNINYIGRIAKDHKGLDIMIKSINSCKKKLQKNKVVFNLYGSDFENNKKEILEMIKELQITNLVKINEPVFNKAKEDVLRETDIFIMTSRYEGQPMSLLEAMSYEVPVIITPGTNMIEDVKEYNAGWICNTDDKVRETLEKVCELNKEEIKGRGKNARRMIIEKYTWSQVGIDTLDNYKGLL